MNRIFVDKQLVVSDCTLLEPDAISSISERMGGFLCYATMFLIGPRTLASRAFVQMIDLDLKLNLYSNNNNEHDKNVLWYCTSIDGIEDGIVIRIFSMSTESVREFVANVLRPLEAVIGDLFCKSL